MKIAALDWGIKRTGLAVTDAEGRMAFPRPTLAMTTREAFFSALLAFIEAERPEAIVGGLPLSLAGEETPTTRQVRNFAARLKRRTPLPVFYMPEALSSSEAEARLAEAGVRPGRRRACLDAQAAVLILESFLLEPPGRRIRA